MSDEHGERRNVRCYWVVFWLIQIWSALLMGVGFNLRQINERLGRVADALERMATKPAEGAK
mgnify:CR=1 FL=1|jgi:hypothetical protein